MERRQKGNKKTTPEGDDDQEQVEKVTDLASLVRRLGLEELEEYILNIYVAGSRAYGTAKADSDWDIIAVYDEKIPRWKWYSMGWLYDHGWMKRHLAWNDEGMQRDFVGYKDLQVWIYTPKTFQELINRYVPFATQCLYFPEENVWKKEVTFTMPPQNLQTLFYSFAGVAELHYERAKLEFGKHEGVGKGKGAKGRSVKQENRFKLRFEAWDLAQSKKTLHHALRFLEFGCQLAEKGTIYDLTAANESKKAILAVEGDRGEDHMRVFCPLYSDTLERLKSLCNCDETTLLMG